MLLLFEYHLCNILCFCLFVCLFVYGPRIGGEEEGRMGGGFTSVFQKYSALLLYLINSTSELHHEKDSKLVTQPSVRTPRQTHELNDRHLKNTK